MPEVARVEFTAAIESVSTLRGHLAALEEEVRDLRMIVDRISETDFRLLTDLERDSGLRLRHPVRVALTLEPDGAVAEWSEALLFGQGNTTAEALVDLRREIGTAYAALSEDVRTGKTPEGNAGRMWETLRFYLEPDAPASQ